MHPRPRLSLCVPTHNRADYLQGALESGLLEAASQPPGTVEVLVCDNASSDDTPGLIAKIQAAHPELRVFRNSENLGFDLNYLRCAEEARGEFVWIMGDDDQWLPGSIARVLRELDAGADACLCLAEACELDLSPVLVLRWYRDPSPPTVWHLDNREDLIRYFNTCAFNAGVFAFISVGIFRRDRFLLSREIMLQAAGSGYVHLWGMMAFFCQPLKLHYIPEALILNRIADRHLNAQGNYDLYGRWMLDLRGWAQVADAIFGDDPELNDAFSQIVRRNHDCVTFLPRLRLSASTRADWDLAVPYLVRAGFSPIRIAAVDCGFDIYSKRHPMLILNPDVPCLVDLRILARGAQRIAILALGGLPSLLEGAALLAALRDAGRMEQVRVFCTPECAELLEGFNLQALDPRRYSRDLPYRESIAQTLCEFAPELLVNLDRNRGIEADDLAAACLLAGSLAFELPERGQEEKLRMAQNASYPYFLPKDAGSDALLEVLGLGPAMAALWPSEAAKVEAREILQGLGWEGAETIAVLESVPSLPVESAFQVPVRPRAGSAWNAMGLGGRGTYALLETLLSPWEGRTANLAGSLSLGSMAALLQSCAGFVGGTPLLKHLAKVCGCVPVPSAEGCHRLAGSRWKGRKRISTTLKKNC